MATLSKNKDTTLQKSRTTTPKQNRHDKMLFVSKQLDKLSNIFEEEDKFNQELINMLMKKKKKDIARKMNDFSGIRQSSADSDSEYSELSELCNGIQEERSFQKQTTTKSIQMLENNFIEMQIEENEQQMTEEDADKTILIGHKSWNASIPGQKKQMRKGGGEHNEEEGDKKKMKSSLLMKKHKKKGSNQGQINNRTNKNSESNLIREMKGFKKNELDELKKKSLKSNKKCTSRRKTKRDLNLVYKQKIGNEHIDKNEGNEKKPIDDKIKYEKNKSEANCLKFVSSRDKLSKKIQSRKHQKTNPNIKTLQKSHKLLEKKNTSLAPYPYHKFQRDSLKKTPGISLNKYSNTLNMPQQLIPIKEKKEKREKKMGQTEHNKTQEKECIVSKLNFNENKSVIERIIEMKHLEEEYFINMRRLLEAGQNFRRVPVKAFLKENEGNLDENRVNKKLLTILLIFLQQFQNSKTLKYSLTSFQSYSKNRENEANESQFEQYRKFCHFFNLNGTQIVQFIINSYCSFPQTLTQTNILSEKLTTRFLVLAEQIDYELSVSLQSFMIKKSGLFSLLYSLREFVKFLLNNELVERTERLNIFMSRSSAQNGYVSSRSKRENIKSCRKLKNNRRNCDSQRKITVEEKEETERGKEKKLPFSKIR